MNDEYTFLLFLAANSLSFNLPSTPGGQPPMTPSSAYIPGTPGGQPMTPGGGGLDMMSPSRGVSPSLAIVSLLNGKSLNCYLTLKFK